MSSTIDFGRQLRSSSKGFFDHLALLCVTMGYSALELTILGLAFNIVVGAIIISGGPLWVAGLVMPLGGACDALDGAVARLTGTDSKVGAFLDSVFDRPADLWPQVAIVVRAAWLNDILTVILGCGAVMVSMLIPYIKARAESLGCQLDDGIMSRAVRFILLNVGLVASVISPIALQICLGLIFAGGIIAVIQRTLATVDQLSAS